MVIKYLTCVFSNIKIAPGHGLRYCEVNGKSHMFLNSKMHKLFKNAKKPLNLRWNAKWRLAHKKGKVEEAKKKQLRQKKEKQVKAIVGLTVEEINKIKESFKDNKQADAQRYKFAQEIKEKRKKYLEKIKKVKGADRKVQDKATKNVKQQKPKGKY